MRGLFPPIEIDQYDLSFHYLYLYIYFLAYVDILFLQFIVPPFLLSKVQVQQPFR